MSSVREVVIMTDYGTLLRNHVTLRCRPMCRSYRPSGTYALSWAGSSSLSGSGGQRRQRPGSADRHGAEKASHMEIVAEERAGESQSPPHGLGTGNGLYQSLLFLISRIRSGAGRSGKPTPMLRFPSGCGSTATNGPNGRWRNPGLNTKP